MSGDAKDRLGFPGLIHGYYNSPEVVPQNLELRCRTMGVEFTKFGFVGRQELVPDFDMTESDVVVMLSVSLGTLEETLKFAWDWVCMGWTGNGRAVGRPLVLESFALLDRATFTPWRLQWRRMDMRAGKAQDLLEGRTPTSPGVDVLFAAAQHPGWMKSHKGVRASYWLPGLHEARTSTEQLQRVPCLWFDGERLGISPDSPSRGDGFVPAYYE